MNSFGLHHLSLIAALISFTTSSGTLVSNPEESPQVLTNICPNQQGRTDKCEVELDVPASCVSSSVCPIVFFFHGAGGTNDWFARTSGVHSAGFIGVYPQGEDGWNTGPKSSNTCTWDDFDCVDDPDEGAFIAAIILELRSRGANGNIYLIGSSNGGALANRLAVNAGDDLPIRGIVALVTQLLDAPPRSGPGVLNYNNPAALNGSGPKISVLNVMGTSDGVIPYEGGSSSVFGDETAFQLMPASVSMETWAAHNGCSTNPVTTAVTTDTTAGGDGTGTFYEYTGCPDGVIVEHYAIHGGGHNAGRSSVNGIAVSNEIAFGFIQRVELGSSSTTPSPVQSPVPTPSPTHACLDDPNWSGMMSSTHTCSHVAQLPDPRCNWLSSDGIRAMEACRATCDPLCNITPSPTLAPTPSCDGCTDRVTPWMTENGYDCSTKWLIDANCNKDDTWIANSFCRYSCFAAGYGYDGDDCCAEPLVCHDCTDEVTPWMADNGYDCSTGWLINNNCDAVSHWIDNKFCQQSCYDAGRGYEKDFCCPPSPLQ